MATIDELQTQRSALVAARSGKARSVRIDDQEVTFRSVAEITAAIDAVDRDIAALRGRRVTTFLPTFSNGID